MWPLLVLGLMARWVALNLIDPLIAYHTVNVMRTLAERMRSVAALGAVQQRDSLEEFAHLWKSNREDTLIGGIYGYRQTLRKPRLGVCLPEAFITATGQGLARTSVTSAAPVIPSIWPYNALTGN